MPATKTAEGRVTYIALIAILGILFLHWIGGVPSSSEGESIAVALSLAAAALAVALHDAWTRQRHALGWGISIVASLAGAFLAANVGGVIVAMLLVLNADVALAAPAALRTYVVLASLMIFTLLGSWGALWAVNRWR